MPDPDKDMIEEIAPKLEHQVVNGSGTDFNDRFHDAMRGDVRLRSKRVGVEGVVVRSDGIFQRLKSVLVNRFGVEKGKVEGGHASILEKRDQRLFEKDYSKMRSFYERVREHLVKFSGKNVGLTPHQQVSEIMPVYKMWTDEFLGDKASVYESDADIRRQIGIILTKKDEGDLKKLRSTLIKRMKQDTDVKHVGHVVRRLLEALELATLMMSDANVKEIPLSVEAVDGLLGRVPKKGEMDAIFENNKDNITTFLKRIGPSSVEFSFSDKHFSFYYDGTDASIVQVLTVVERAKPAHVLMCHYRTDDDALRLFADMSQNEYLKVSIRGKSGDEGALFIEGRTGDEGWDVRYPLSLKEHGIDEADFRSHPMKYLAHEFDHFYRSEQAGKAKWKIRQLNHLKKNGSGTSHS